MHPLHEHLASSLHPHLKNQRIVVWYDLKGEFAPFVNELLGGKAVAPETLVPFEVQGLSAHLVTFGGSFFGVKVAVEPLFAEEVPSPVLIYLAGVDRDPQHSVLMELELAGRKWEPQFKRESRRCLQRAGFTDGDIDTVLKADALGYDDIVRMLASGNSPDGPALLKTIFSVTDSEALITEWVGDETGAYDGPITEKVATPELAKLVRSRVGYPFADPDLNKARTGLQRFLLVNEFRSDLRGTVPADLAGIPGPETREQMDRIKAVVERLRREQPDAYTRMADRIEQEVNLKDLGLEAGSLGSLDTFRFEEKALFQWCAELLVKESYTQVMALVSQRRTSFWLLPDRKNQWEACKRMAELGKALEETKGQLGQLREDPGAWLEWYTDGKGVAQGFLVDQLYRSLETWVSGLDDEPEAHQAYGVIRRAYEAFCHRTAEGFTKALVKSGWQVPGWLSQTRVFEDEVRPKPAKKAFLLVDALRYEMGASLAARLSEIVEDLRLRPVLAALPSITTVGMAALMPGSAAAFEVVAQDGHLAAKVDGVVLGDLVARKRHLNERVPSSEDMDLNEVLVTPASRLAAKLSGADLVIVRSQEIDHSGEGGFSLVARRTMEELLTTGLVKAVRKLAAAGVEHFILCADHGHQFTQPKEDDMKLGAPSGQTVESHRRCWIGRGLQVIPGSVKASSQDLGYSSDLEFLFPMGAGVFKTGGDLSFHHGGPSLQELVVPLITFRMKGVDSAKPEKVKLTLTGVPDKVTNRIFTIGLDFPKTLFGETLRVRPVLVAKGQIVGEAGMADRAVLDRATGCVTLEPGVNPTVALLLANATVASVQIHVLDPKTDTVLAKSGDIPLQLGI